MTALRGGHPEPEYRVLAMVFPAVIGPMGVLTFGLVIANHKSYWPADVGFAMLSFGLTAASNVVVTYAVDTYRPVRLLHLPHPHSTRNIELIIYGENKSQAKS